MPEAVPFNLPFDEAIAYFQAKGYAVSPDSWRDVWQQAHARAFTVARVTSMDVLQDIRGEVRKALDSGTSLSEFKKNLRPMLEQKGWFSPVGEKPTVTLPDGTTRKRLTARRLDLIYNTNLQSAYSVGRYKQMSEAAEGPAARPYWQYKAILDSVTRMSHAAMNNKVYDHRHPIWDKWYPPNGFHCRCYVKSLSGDDLQERGLKEETAGIGFEPDEGWRYNVGKEGMSTGWDKNAGLPDCPFEEFAELAEGGCIKIVPSQRTWKDYGRPDLRDVPADRRLQAPEVLRTAPTHEAAVQIMETALGLGAGQGHRVIRTPIEDVVLSSDMIPHMVGKRSDARERYGLYVAPTLMTPFEVYLTEYEDGLRSRYIGLFTGKENLLVVVRINRDGSLLWNVMQARDKAMNKLRVGTLAWPK